MERGKSDLNTKGDTACRRVMGVTIELNPQYMHNFG